MWCLAVQCSVGQCYIICNAESLLTYQALSKQQILLFTSFFWCDEVVCSFLRLFMLHLGHMNNRWSMFAIKWMTFIHFSLTQNSRPSILEMLVPWLLTKIVWPNIFWCKYLTKHTNGCVNLFKSRVKCKPNLMLFWLNNVYSYTFAYIYCILANFLTVWAILWWLFNK